MRKTLGALMVFIVVFGVIFYMNNPQDSITNSSEYETTWLMKLSIDAKDYEGFKKYLIETKKDLITEDEFLKLKEISTAGWSEESYRLIKFQNGKMLLVNLTPRDINGKYYIQDVIEVPDNMKKLFNIKHGVK